MFADKHALPECTIESDHGTIEPTAAITGNTTDVAPNLTAEKPRTCCAYSVRTNGIPKTVAPK